jgi:hypothetical protein
MNAYGPTTSEIPPPYTFVPKKIKGVDGTLPDVKDDNAVQELSVLLDIV